MDLSYPTPKEPFNHATRPACVISEVRHGIQNRPSDDH